MTQLPPSPGSARLAEAIDAAIAGYCVAADGRAVRRDGWTPERIRLFLESLAECGSVTRAAAAAGMSARSAYKLRDRVSDFDAAWNLAGELARPILPLVSRILHGSVKVTVRNGIVWERHYLDNRLLMATLTRLDRQALAIQQRGGPAIEDFDSLVELACADAAGRRDDSNARGKCNACELSASPGEAGSAQPDPSTLPAPVPGSLAHPTRAIARRNRLFCELNPPIQPPRRRHPRLGIPSPGNSRPFRLKIPPQRLPPRPDGAKRPPSRGCSPQPDPASTERLGLHGS